MQYSLNCRTESELVEMRDLSLVKTLTRLKEERKHSEEVSLESAGLTFKRGTLAEFAGGPSTGKTSLTLSLLSKLTRAGEVCAVVDSTDSFDPCSAVTSGVEIENLLWVKCGGDIEKAFLSADYLVQAKGFGAVWLNLSGLPKHQLRMVPKTYWYRYRTRIKETPTIVLVTSQEPVTGSASQHAFTLSRGRVEWLGEGRYKLLKEFSLNLHSRKEFYGKQMPASVGFDYADAYDVREETKAIKPASPRGRKPSASPTGKRQHISANPAGEQQPISASPLSGRQHKASGVSPRWDRNNAQAHEMGDRAAVQSHQLPPPSCGGERAKKNEALAEYSQYPDRLRRSQMFVAANA
jgi:hypothetical protein